MFRKTLSIAALIALSLGAASAALAQSGVEVEQQAPAPPKFEIIRPKDADIYIGNPVINYDPAFIAPFTKETETGRMGLAGWGSPVGVVTFDAPQNRREPGWLSFGF